MKGPIPVVLCAFLLTYKKEIAIYEDGLYQPEITIEMYERLLRAEEYFEIQKIELPVYAKRALSKLATTLSTLNIIKRKKKDTLLLDVVKPLVLFTVKLPTYSQKTKKVELPELLAVRDLLLITKDPYALIFNDIPKALGFTFKSDKDIPKLISGLSSFINEFSNNYYKLLNNIEQTIRNELRLEGDESYVRKMLITRSTPLVGYTADMTLALLIKELSNLRERDWREVVARIINSGRPPKEWDDQQLITFNIRIKQICSDYIRLEELVAEQKKSAATRIIRIGILDGKMNEVRDTITVSPDNIARVEKLSNEILDYLYSKTGITESDRRLRLAAISNVALIDIEGVHEKNDE